MSEDTIKEAASEMSQEDRAFIDFLTKLDDPDKLFLALGLQQKAKEARKRRGRPTRWDEAKPSIINLMYLDDKMVGKSRRSQVNAVYEKVAVETLCFEGNEGYKRRQGLERFFWLTGCKVEEDRLLQTGKGKPSILVELGRLVTAYGDGAEIAFNFAQALTDAKPRPTVKEAVARIRRYRLQREGAAGDVEALTEAIVKAIDSFVERYPKTSPATIEDALGRASSWYELLQEETQGAKE